MSATDKLYGHYSKAILRLDQITKDMKFCQWLVKECPKEFRKDIIPQLEYYLESQKEYGIVAYEQEVKP
jgi:hypothetical protein